MKKIIKLIQAIILLLFVSTILFSCKKEKNNGNNNSDTLTQEDIVKIIETNNLISQYADSVLTTTNPEIGMQIAVEKFKLLPNIEIINYDHSGLNVRYKKGGWVTWLNKISDENESGVSSKSIFKGNIKLNTSKSVKAIESTPKLLVINQQSNDLERLQFNNFIDSCVNIEIDKGANITYIKGFDFKLSVCKSGLKGYDGIYINTHGSYHDGLTWLATGQEIPLQKEWVSDNINEWHSDYFKIGLVEETRNGVKEYHSYVMISQKYIDENYQPGDFVTCFFYSGSCQFMKDPEKKIAQILMSKGVKKVAGYDETVLTYNGTTVLGNFILNMPNGDSYNDVYNSFPESIRTSIYTDKNSHDKITAHLVSVNEGEDFRFNIPEPPTPTDGLVAYYPFKGNPNDESGNDVNGSVIGSLQLVPDRHGNIDNAYNFDGNQDNYIIIPPTSVTNLQNLSICAWVKPNSNGGFIVSAGRDIEKGSFGLNNSSFFTQVWGTTNGCGTNNYLPLNEWSFVVGTLDGQKSKYYINGQVADSATISSLFTADFPCHSLVIGVHSTFCTPSSAWPYPFNGVIDDIRIYNRALTKSEINALYNE